MPMHSDNRGSGLVLVDCGQGGHPTGVEALAVALRATGHELGDVRHLVVTHYDTDHMGNLGAVKQASDCVVWGHARSDAFFDVVDDPGRAERRRRSMAVAGGADDELAAGVASVGEEVEGADAPIRPDRLLEGGTTLEAAAGEWRSVELPGHSPSQVGLWHQEQRMLISADAMVSTFSAFGDAEGSDDPIDEWRSSIERIRALDARVAFPGHGRPITDVAALAEDYRAGVRSGPGPDRGPAGPRAARHGYGHEYALRGHGRAVTRGLAVPGDPQLPHAPRGRTPSDPERRRLRTNRLTRQM